MSGVKVSHRGSFNKIDNFLKNALNISNSALFNRIGKAGVDALAANTPKDSGLTADSWYYEVVRTDTSVEIVWKNRNQNKGIPIAILIQYGHGTRTGGYVEGFDYINPAMQVVFEKLVEELWREVLTL